jgi:hypothetical protein
MRYRAEKIILVLLGAHLLMRFAPAVDGAVAIKHDAAKKGIVTTI